MTTPAPVSPRYDAVLFASFGGPEGQDDVIPFLRNVTRGRGVPDERLEEVAGHYRALGGRSPINAQNRALIAALEEELARRDVSLPIYFGNRNWEPYTADALTRLHADGHRRVLALITSAYSSYSGCRQYREDFAQRLDEAGLLGEVEITKSRSYFNHPGFLAPVVDGVRTALEELAREGHDLDSTTVLFSTHSIPTAMTEASGPAGAGADGQGGWYVAQHLAACRYVMDELGDELPELPDWQLVYQSRSGAPHVPWLEPDVNDVIESLASSEQAEAVVVVPIGFVTDHVEVIWDLDTEAKETAAEHGLAFRRVATSGTDPRFVAALADVVQEHLDPSRERLAVTELPVVEDVCGHNCCQVSAARAVPDARSIDTLEEIAAMLREAREGAPVPQEAGARS
ncbi:ferrochelatase [Brachybacterium phenoliresistens]|uniref:Coproporphyrin III ferrochelatase n=1 Tax=Brachybacterium phenoliresistens TaxID=396014 RepID=Z9JQF3_9MICO|nr:ferrochelatase [Brachybacterium phenoliresistens]EWS79977.1 ferrochelatase [Brachybacterium phenoliresistens]